MGENVIKHRDVQPPPRSSNIARQYGILPKEPVAPRRTPAEAAALLDGTLAVMAANGKHLAVLPAKKGRKQAKAKKRKVSKR